MREVSAAEITQAVKGLFIDANIDLGEDVLTAFRKALETEESPTGKEVLNELIENARIAKEEGVAICQDTGLAVVFVELGQDVHVTGGDLIEAINQGVRQGYQDGYLRKSACHCFTRKNTGDNTPAIVHLEIVPGSTIKLIAAPKGGGSENMSRVMMLTPSVGLTGIKEFIVQRVKESGANPCPPVIVGVGIGGTFEQAALIAKKALLRPIGSTNPDAEAAAIEEDLLKRINNLGIGPQGYGGRTTALAVHVNMIPCHIASLPVAVNIQCHAHRHKEAVI
ncbi:MAG: fumarate hydratase [Deltaproteobacteria bacterium RBG_16_54_11]|nr:MAG: fumarate hydratase [Deltaproteobacteria bacterium RBG_16_54_11]